MTDVLVAIDLGSTRTKSLVVKAASVTQIIVENGPKSSDSLVGLFAALDQALSGLGGVLDETDQVIGLIVATSWPSVVVHVADGRGYVAFAFDDPRCVCAGEPTFEGGVLACSLQERIAFVEAEGLRVSRLQTFGGAVNERLGGNDVIDEWTAAALGDMAPLSSRGLRFEIVRPGEVVGSAVTSVPAPVAGAPLLSGSGDTLVAAVAASEVFESDYYLELGTSAVLLRTRPHEPPELVAGWPRFGQELVETVLSPGGADARVLVKLRDSAFDTVAVGMADQISHSTPIIDGVARLDRGRITISADLLAEPASRRFGAALAMLLMEVQQTVGDGRLACGGWLAEGPTFVELASALGLESVAILRSSTASGLALVAAGSLGRSDMLASVRHFASEGLEGSDAAH